MPTFSSRSTSTCGGQTDRGRRTTRAVLFFVLGLVIGPAVAVGQNETPTKEPPKAAAPAPAGEQKETPKPAGEQTEKPAAAEGTATDVGVAELDRLLEKLAGLPAAAWQARLAGMQEQIRAEQTKAAELRAEALELEKRARRADRRAARLGAEMKRLAQLRELLGGPAAAADGAGAKPAPAQTGKEPDAKPAPKAMSTDAKPGGQAGIDVRLVSYEEHVRPIFEEHCTTCHEQGDASGGLDLGSYVAALQGGSSGRTLVPGEPEASRLYLLVSHKERPTMPKDGGRIPDAQIEAIRQWIALGAPENDRAARTAAEKRAVAEQRAAEERTASAGATPAKKEPARVVMPTGLAPIEKALGVRAPAAKCLALSPTAPLLAVPGLGQILLYRSDDLAELGVVAFPFGQIESLSFQANGAKLLAAGGRPGRQGGAVLFDVETGEPLARWDAGSDSVLAAALAPDGSFAALGGTRRRVEVFSTASGERRFEVPHDDFVLSVDVSRDGKLLASADRSGMIRVTEADTGRDVHELRGHEGAVNAVRFRPDGKLLASAGRDGTVRAFRMRDGRQVWSQNAHGGEALALAWRGDALVASGGSDGRLRLWKADGGNGGKLPALGEWVYALAFTGDGDRLFAADWLGCVSAVDPKAQNVVQRALLAGVQQ